MSPVNRRTILTTGSLALAHGSFAAARGEIELGPTPLPKTGAAFEVPASFPSTDPELVGGVVGAAHTDLDRVVELVTARPHLARATVDWGFGDWESALGAASHMGRRDIAEFLLENGARPNIFSAAMMGQLAVVRALVEASPGVQRIAGPHGFTLLHHARVGGDAAAAVVEYLEGVGDADLRPDGTEMDDQQRQQFIGTYAFEADSRGSLEISDIRGTLSLQREGAPFGRRIFPVSDTAFYPSGSPTVRIEFDIENGRATALRVIDNEVLVTATRMM